MARLLPFPSAVLLLLLPLSFLAATIHVPSQEPSIQAGLNAASAGDTVLVSCGTYYEHDIDMKPSVCVARANARLRLTRSRQLVASTEWCHLDPCSALERGWGS